MLDTSNTVSYQVPHLPAILALHGQWRAKEEAVVCEEDRLTWSQLMRLCHQFANGLAQHNIEQGSRVGIVMSNGIPMLQTLLGVMSSGSVSVPINLSVNDDALVNMFKDAGVTTIVATDDQVDRINALRSRLPSTVKLFICESQHEGWLSIAGLTKGQSSEIPDVTISDDDLLNIIYSSGTTGIPKGIVHTFRARRDWCYDLAIALRYQPKARTLLTIGLYSNISWIGMLCTLLAGGTVVIHKQFDAKAFLQTVEEEKITHTAMVPIQYQRIAAEIPKQNYSVSTMQAMMCCGSPLHPELKQQLFKYFPCGLIELYGLTEGIITTLDPESAEGRWSSVGKPLIGTDIIIVDENDKPLPANKAGEIVSRGRIMMHSYFQNSKATQDSLYIDKNGASWLRSGDIGYVDDDGFLFIVDRKKDMILSGGQNIYPQDIEAILKSHNNIDDVAVIGVNSKRWGETPLALVIPSTTSESENQLLQWANSVLGKQQRLVDLKYVTSLPRNPNGKLLKRELRQLYTDMSYE